MSFLNVKIMLLFYIISRHGTSLGPKGLNFGPGDVDMFSTDCQLSYGLNCFFTVKPIKVKTRYFALKFLLVQSCTYETSWCFVHHQTTFNMFLPNYKLKIFCAFRATLGKGVTLKP